MDWQEQLASLLPDMPQTESEVKEEVSSTVEHLPRLRVELDKRKGKTATLITEHTGTDEQIEELGQCLRRRLAVGGSVRGGEILLQGDVRERVTQLLTELGYKVKRINF